MIRIVTLDLVLRTPAYSDLDGYMALNNDARVLRYVGTTLAREPKEILTWIDGLAIRFPGESQRGVWAAEHNRAFAGSFMLRPSRDSGELELGYRLVPSLWGKGLATEACRALLTLAPRERVIARIHRDNIASRAVAERLGMTLKRKYEWNGEPSVEYAISP